jgi:hypothetical protein
MVSLAKLLRIRQGVEKKYKNMGLEKFLLSNRHLENQPSNIDFGSFIGLMAQNLGANKKLLGLELIIQKCPIHPFLKNS